MQKGYWSKTIEESFPLPTYKIRFELPKNWNSEILKYRRDYINDGVNRSIPRSMQETLDIIQSLIRLSNSRASRGFVEGVSWNVVSLFEFYVLLSDRKVTEIFCSKLGSELIVTHREHGRCKTNLLFSPVLWEALKNRAEFDSGKCLSPLTPALKVGFETNVGSLRVSIQVEPLSIEGPVFSLRRLPDVSLTLGRLVNENQISKTKSEFLQAAIKARKNIVIAGEPGSGKTTLANALLLCVNPAWRLIVIEDASEIRVPVTEFPLLTRFSMPTVGEENRDLQRATEIARLLHRSPDYVFLGEVQNESDTRISMEGFAAGIRGMATTHGYTLDGLLARWQQSHKLEKNLLRVIDIIVFTKRIFGKNKVQLVVDNIYIQKSTGKEFFGYTRWNDE